jgi:hypothetical protein
MLALWGGYQPQSDHGISLETIHRGLDVSGGPDRRSSILGRENLQVVVALAVGWGLDRVQFSREQMKAELRVRTEAESRVRMEEERAVAVLVQREMEFRPVGVSEL